MANKEIQFSPQLIGDLLDIIHNAILISDVQNRIIFANNRTAEMFRTEVNILHGLDMTRLFMPEDLETLVANILKITRENGEFEGEVMLRRPDGSTFLGLLASTFFLWDNREEGMAFTIHDLSGFKALEQSLVRSERIAFLGHLVDDISHQLRNPVTVIGGFSRRLNAECRSSKEILAIIREADYLENLLNSLNHFIRLPAPSLNRIRISELSAAMEKRLGDKVHALGCRWSSSCQTGIGEQTLLVDKDLLLAALESITVNACESYERCAGIKEVSCEVSLAEDETWPYTIRITDRGCGIAEEQLGHVFSHFYSGKTKHIGMGLTFARRIVKEQMGSITVESVVGRGTSVICHLIKERRRTIRTSRLG